MKNVVTKPEQQQRVIRVFISSTFQDMKEEREELVKHVFPKLRKICEQRGVVWGEVDLRWGITDEQKAEGKVLPICLEEIRECRPYFIGILGERYGHIPKEIPDDLIKQEPWLEEHKGKSVTELEILHGVLNNPEMADHAYFYFRDPAYAESLPGEIKSHHPEKLASLKDRIRKSGLPVREDYSNPKELGELVFEDLKAIIDRRFPEGSELEPLDREAGEHEAFAQAKQRVYIGRKEYFDRLDEHTESDSQPLVVLGESGSGKSALLANWSVKYRDENPDDHLIMHFIGSTPYSSDWAAMLRRIMGEFKRRFDIKEEIPTEPDKLRSAFANWLHMASAALEKEGNKIILILDALNQLEDHDNAPDLVWLPPFIPENIRLVLSTLPGRPLDDLRKREWPTMQANPLKDDERKQLIKEYLAQYRKTLSEKRVERIASAEQTRNPLYLSALLEELRVFGEHRLLDERIEHYLETENIPSLYEKIFERYEEDYERDSPGLISDTMTFLWASRRGLSETELVDLLGSDNEPLPQAYWAPFYITADKLFVNRSGLIGFSHDYQRQAIQDRYLQTEEDKKSAYIRLADYFSEQDLTSRKVDELPWQLSEAESWQRLYDLLSDLEFFDAAWEKDKLEVKAYWAQVENSSDLSLVDAYQPMLDAPDKVSKDETVMHVSGLLRDTGHLSEALSLGDFLSEFYRRVGEDKKLAGSLSGQGWIFHQRGDYDGAMKLYKESERICHELGDKSGLSFSFGNQGIILWNRGDLEGAMKLYEESERIYRELGDKSGLSMSLHSQGIILYLRGDLEGAMKLNEESERIFRELGDKSELSKNLNNQGIILKERGDFDGAIKLYKESERICRELGDKSGLSKSLNNQGNILENRGDYDDAMKLYKESEHIKRELGDKHGLSASLGYQGFVLYRRGDYDGAMKLYKEQERICRELGNKHGLSASLGKQGIILMERGDYDGAMKLYREQKRICRELEDKHGLSVSLNNQGLILHLRGDYDGAMKLQKESERIFRELGDKYGLSNSLNNQGDALKELGKLDEAMNILKEAESLAREIGVPDVLAESLIHQADVLLRKGNPEKALPLAEEAYEIATKHEIAEQIEKSKAILDKIRAELGELS